MQPVEAATNGRCSGGAEGDYIVPGVLEIGNESLPPRFENANDLTACLIAGLPGGNIVETKIGENDVEAAVRKLNLSGVLVFYFGAVGDTLELDVMPSFFRRIAGEIGLAPNIDTDGFAGSKFFSGTDHEQAAASAYVQDCLVTAPLKAG